jgi:outer membrane protein assembly factor BamA
VTRRTSPVLLVSLAILLLAEPAAAQQPIIAAIQVQGNTLTPDEEVIRQSGLSQGSVFSEALLTEAADRVKAAGRYQHVEVLKRYASIEDPSQILVLIRVDEGPVRVVPGAFPGQAPHVARRGVLNLMFVPLLDAEDGYGVSYGAQFALSGSSSRSTRVVFPATWGGDKRVGAELQKELAGRFAPRIRIGGVVQRRRHPYFDENADRTGAWARAEWSGARWLRAGSTAAWQKTTLETTDTAKSIGLDAVIDTRVDPLSPYNAVYVRAAIDRLQFSDRALWGSALEGDGYIGVYRGTVLGLRAFWQDVSRPAPAYYKSVLGGTANLRGFRAGTAVGDTMAGASAELRIPMTSPLRIARFGTSVFIDTATIFDKGKRLSDQPFRKGVGAGIWFTAPLFQMNIAVAHGLGATTRVHFGAGLTF